MVDLKIMKRGFLLMSGYHLHGVLNNDYMQELVRADIWDNFDMEKRMNSVHQIVAMHEYFSTMRTWDYNVRKLIGSDNATLAFICGLGLAAGEYKKNDGSLPTHGQAGGEKIQKIAWVTADRFLYEWIKGLWSGHGDTRAGDLIKKMEKWEKSDGIGKFPILCTNSEWEKLLHLIIKEGKLNEDDDIYVKYNEGSDKQYFADQIKNIMVHYYCMKGINHPKEHSDYKGHEKVAMHWDHIIPERLNGDLADKEKWMLNGLANISALPKADNLDKGKNPPSKCESDVKKALETYADLTEGMCDALEDGGSVKGLSDLEDEGSRASIFVKSFLEARKKILPDVGE